MRTVGAEGSGATVLPRRERDNTRTPGWSLHRSRVSAGGAVGALTRLHVARRDTAWQGPGLLLLPASFLRPPSSPRQQGLLQGPHCLRLCPLGPACAPWELAPWPRGRGAPPAARRGPAPACLAPRALWSSPASAPLRWSSRRPGSGRGSVPGRGGVVAWPPAASPASHLRWHCPQLFALSLQ